MPGPAVSLAVSFVAAASTPFGCASETAGASDVQRVRRRRCSAITGHSTRGTRLLAAS
jgi:hypothetical protein